MFRKKIENIVIIVNIIMIVIIVMIKNIVINIKAKSLIIDTIVDIVVKEVGIMKSKLIVRDNLILKKKREKNEKIENKNFE